MRTFARAVRVADEHEFERTDLAGLQRGLAFGVARRAEVLGREPDGDVNVGLESRVDGTCDGGRVALRQEPRRVGPHEDALDRVERRASLADERTGGRTARGHAPLGEVVGQVDVERGGAVIAGADRRRRERGVGEALAEFSGDERRGGLGERDGRDEAELCRVARGAE